MIIRLNAGHDANGNPRRVYVRLSRDGTVREAWDEGYLGPHAVPSRYRRQAAACDTFEITHEEYRRRIADDYRS